MDKLELKKEQLETLHILHTVHHTTHRILRHRHIIYKHNNTFPTDRRQGHKKLHKEGITQGMAKKTAEYGLTYDIWSLFTREVGVMH